MSIWGKGIGCLLVSGLLLPASAQRVGRTVEPVSTMRYEPEKKEAVAEAALPATAVAADTVASAADRLAERSLTRDAQDGLTLQVAAASRLSVRLVGDSLRTPATADIYAVKVAEGVYRLEGQTGRFDIDGGMERLHLAVAGGSDVELSGVRPRRALEVAVMGGSTFRIVPDTVADRQADTLPDLDIKADRWAIVSTEVWPVRQARVSAAPLSAVGLNAPLVHVLSGGGMVNNRFDRPDTSVTQPASDLAAVPSSSRPASAVYVYATSSRDESSASGIDPKSEPLTWVQDWAGGYVDGFLPKVWRGKQRFRGHWMGLEFGYNYYHTPHSGLGTVWPETPYGCENLQLNYGKSGSFAWNVFQVSVGFNSVHWGLVTGMGFQWDNYRFDEAATVPVRENGNLTFRPYAGEAERHYIKSKLGVSYFRIPVLLEYNHAKRCGRCAFHISAGAVPAVKMMAWTKQTYETPGGGRHKDKAKNGLYVNPFKVDLVVSAGWGPLSLYFSYAPTRLFLKNKAVDLTPFGFGLWLGIF